MVSSSSRSAAQILQMPLWGLQQECGGGDGIPTSLFVPLGRNSEPLVTPIIVLYLFSVAVAMNNHELMAQNSMNILSYSSGGLKP